MLETNHTILDVQGNKVVSIEDNPLVPQTLKVGSLDMENKKLDLVNLNVPRDIALPDGIVAKKLIHSPVDDPSMKFRQVLQIYFFLNVCSPKKNFLHCIVIHTNFSMRQKMPNTIPFFFVKTLLKDF